jgi:hypothetical protein
MRRFTLSSAVTLVASGVVDAQRQCADREQFVHSKVPHPQSGAKASVQGNETTPENAGGELEEAADSR